MAGILRSPSLLTFQIALGGKSNVGKTALFQTISDLQLDRQGYTSVQLEDDHVEASFTHDGNVPVQFTMWDTGGLERYRSMTRSYFKDLTCMILVHRASPYFALQDVQEWMEQAKCFTEDTKTLFSIWCNSCNETSEEEQADIFKSVLEFAKLHGIDPALCFTIPVFEKEQERILAVSNAFNATLNAVIERKKWTDSDSVFIRSDSIQLTLKDSVHRRTSDPLEPSVLPPSRQPSANSEPSTPDVPGNPVARGDGDGGTAEAEDQRRSCWRC